MINLIFEFIHIYKHLYVVIRENLYCAIKRDIRNCYING